MMEDLDALSLLVLIQRATLRMIVASNFKFPTSGCFKSWMRREMATIVMGILLVSVFLLFIAKAEAAGSFEQPESIVTFRGGNESFSCSGNGTIFWKINNTLHDFNNAMSFAKRGIHVELSYLPDQLLLESRVQVETSLVPNGNTSLACSVIDHFTVVSSNRKDLVIVDVPAPHLHLVETNPRAFQLTWSSIDTPPDYTIQFFTIEVSDEQGRVLETRNFSANSQDYTYIYESGQRRPDFPKCSRLTFSLMAISINGTRSPRMDVLWDNTRDFTEMRGESCLLLDSATAQVSFTKPELCPFQTAHFNISLLKVLGTDAASGNDITTAVSSHANTVSSSMKQYQVEELTDLSLDLGGDYKAIVEVTVNDKGTRREQTHCFLNKTASTKGLKAPQASGSGGGPNGGYVAVMILAALMALLTCVLNSLAIGCVVYKTKSNM